VLDEEAAAAGPGAGGLLALPYFLGEKTPVNDPDARGVFVGLHLGHERGHLFRAILEAIAFGFAHHLDVFRELGLEPRRVRVTNGGSRSRVWRQIVADVLGLPLESITDHPGSSLGAAFAAGIGVGVFRDWNEIQRFVRVDARIEPNTANHDRYVELYGHFRSLYPASRDHQHALARFTETAGR
jgi:xylulokinase